MGIYRQLAMFVELVYLKVQSVFINCPQHMQRGFLYLFTAVESLMTMFVFQPEEHEAVA